MDWILLVRYDLREVRIFFSSASSSLAWLLRSAMKETPLLYLVIYPCSIYKAPLNVLSMYCTELN